MSFSEKSSCVYRNAKIQGVYPIRS
jgi:hypothetical protein